MFAHLWREAIFRDGPRAISVRAAEAVAIAMAIILIGASLTRAENIEASTAPVDTEHLFGFVEGADIGKKGEAEFVIDSSLRDGKSAGSFANAAPAIEMKYTAFENFRISAVATTAYYDIAGVTGLANANRAAVQSFAFDARFRVLDRAQAPFGLTLSIAPHWGLFDETSGVRADHFGTEAQLLADRELISGRLGGAINLLFANDRARLLASDGIAHESILGAGSALAAQIAPGLWIGAEARYLRDYTGPALNVFSGDGFYAGPTVYARIGRRAFVSVAWDFQIRGHATAAPGALDLTNFERHQGKLRFGFEF